jgi:hypothetical protein
LILGLALEAAVIEQLNLLRNNNPKVAIAAKSTVLGSGTGTNVN